MRWSFVFQNVKAQEPMLATLLAVVGRTINRLACP
jgi:hypothetical protein